MLTRADDGVWRLQNLAMTERGRAEVEGDPDLPRVLVQLLRCAEDVELLGGLAGALALLSGAARCLAQVGGAQTLASSLCYVP